LRYNGVMSPEARPAGPVKAWIEPDRWAFMRAFPLQMAGFVLVTVVSVALAFAVHPLFWLLSLFALFRHAAAEASLRELWREGMLHPARVVARGFLATLVRLEADNGVQDAVVVSPLPRRWRTKAPPWGGDRAAVVIAGHPPKLRPLSADFAGADVERARRATERIPEGQWDALDSALAQLSDLSEGVHPVELGQKPWYGTLSEIEESGSYPEHVPSAQAHVWCAGLPCIEEPTMEPRERERVGKLRRRALVRALLWAIAGTIPPVLAVATLGVLEQQARPYMAFLSTGGVVTFLVSPLFLLWAWGALRDARNYAGDLAHGRVLRFGGTLSSFDSLALDPDLAQLTRKNLLAPEPGLEQDMVVLPVSHELLYANGSWARSRQRLHVERIAPPPEEPLKLPLPDDVESQTTRAVSVARRRMTTLEVEELSRHAARLREPGRLFWVLAVFAGLALISWHVQGWKMPPEPVSIPLALAGWAFAFVNVMRRVRLANRLSEDAELGWVLTVDHEPSLDSGDVELPARGVETLLHARLDWTVNRRPATWRRFGRRLD
jgi:hypothetical protein